MDSSSNSLQPKLGQPWCQWPVPNGGRRGFPAARFAFSLHEGNQFASERFGVLLRQVNFVFAAVKCKSEYDIKRNFKAGPPPRP